MPRLGCCRRSSMLAATSAIQARRHADARPCWIASGQDGAAGWRSRSVGAIVTERKPRQAVRAGRKDAARSDARLFGLAAALALSAGSRQDLATRADLEKPNVSLAVGGKTLVAYLPLTIAERRGYFTKEGLERRDQRFPGRRQGARSAGRRQRRRRLRRLRAHALHGGQGSVDQSASRCRPIRSASSSASRRTRRRPTTTLTDLKGMKIGVTAPARPAPSD